MIKEKVEEVNKKKNEEKEDKESWMKTLSALN